MNNKLIRESCRLDYFGKIEYQQGLYGDMAKKKLLLKYFTKSAVMLLSSMPKQEENLPKNVQNLIWRIEYG